jgi:hypothetical protein
MKKKIICVCAILAILGTGATVAVAFSGKTTRTTAALDSPTAYDVISIKSREELIAELEKEKQEALKNPQESPYYEEEDLELQQKREAFVAEEAKLDQIDLTALAALGKHTGKEYKALATTLKAEYAVMGQMIALLDGNTKLAAEEKTLLLNYLERRIDWIEANPALQKEVQGVLDAQS